MKLEKEFYQRAQAVLEMSIKLQTIQMFVNFIKPIEID